MSRHIFAFLCLSLFVIARMHIFAFLYLSLPVYAVCISLLVQVQLTCPALVLLYILGFILINFVQIALYML